MSASFPWLTLVLWLPLIGALAVLMLPAEDHRAIRQAALATTLATFAASLPLFVLFRLRLVAFGDLRLRQFFTEESSKQSQG